jgi:hypothetical protein
MSYLLQALKYFPAILAAVYAVEQTIGAGKGETKLATVLSCVTAVAGIGEQVDNKQVQLISGMASGIVGVLNNSGVFNHGPATTEAK